MARRQARKAVEVERLDLERQQRLDAMSPAERARYDAWVRAHAPGPQDVRVQAKMSAAYGIPAATSRDDMTVEQIQARLNEIEQEIRNCDAAYAIAERIGVFA